MVLSVKVFSQKVFYDIFYKIALRGGPLSTKVWAKRFLHLFIYSDSFYPLFNFSHLSRQTSPSFALTSLHSYHDTSHLNQIVCQINNFSISTNCWIRRFPHRNSASFFTKLGNFFKWSATKTQQHSSDSFSIIKKTCRKWLLFTKVHFGPKCIPSHTIPYTQIFELSM